MTTRLALVLAVLLLALAVLQWRLRSVAEAPLPASPAAVGVSAAAGSDAAAAVTPDEEVEEPVIEIPEYVPQPVTERPRTPLGFGEPALEIDLGVPRIGGEVDDEVPAADPQPAR